MVGRGEFLFRRLFLCCSVLCFLTATFGGASAVLAQDDDEFVLEEIVVTGSRIVRNNNESSSPIVTVDEKLFQNQSTVAIETALNKLPQFTPTLHVPTFGGDIQPNARNTPGSATVALRGIGENRTLVLINGRRGTPANALGVVDINSIPAAAIEYAETISGGASSTYGADAMAGVLNFIMKERFEGLQFDAQASINEEGDNLEYQYSGIIGSNIADDRGNISMAFSYTDRQDAKRKDHEWYTDEWRRPTVGGDQFFSPYSGIALGYGNHPDPAVVNSVLGLPAGQGFTSMTGVTIFADDNGNAFSGFNTASKPGIPAAQAAGLVDGYQVKLGANGLLSTNNIDNYLIFPMERYNMFTRGNYELNDWVGVFGQGYFSKVKTTTIQEGSPIVSGWGVNIDPDINRDVIPGELLAILDSRPDPGATFELNALLPNNRGSETEVYTYNMVAGLEGKIPKIDWTWEAFVSQGESETTVIQTGFGSVQRMQQVITQPNFGQGFSIKGNQGAPNYGFGASTATCTSGLNPFAWDTVTDDCFAAINANIKAKMVMEQTIYEANAQGAIVELPAGELRGALGVSYRSNDYVFQNDTLTTQGTSFIEQALGLYPAGNSEGSIETTEEYAELLIPVLKDLPFIQGFNIELGGRRSDYDTTGVSYTYKALADWRTTEWLRFRGGFNRAERAPNIAELFLAPEQTFAIAGGGDVCSTENLQRWSANDATNPAHWQDVVALCGQLMEASGNPDADESFYGAGITYQDVANGVTPTNFMSSGFSFLFPTTIGNAALTPETADTWVVGAVIDSPFKDITALADIRLSIDYYIIEIEDAIGEQSADVVMQQCTDVRFNPTFDPNSPFCAGFNRNQTGVIGDLQRTFFNNGRFKTSGLDISLNWGMDLGPGRLGVNSLANYLISKKSAELEVLPLVEFAGTQGPTQNGLNGGSYRFRLLTDFSYQISDLRVAVQWQHLGPIDSALAATSSQTTIQGVREYDLFNLNGSYNLLDNLTLRFGVDNVLEEKPPYSGQNYAATDGMIGGTFAAGFYDTVGRRYWLGARVNF